MPLNVLFFTLEYIAMSPKTTLLPGFSRRFRRRLPLLLGNTFSRRSLPGFFGCLFLDHFFLPLLSELGKPTLDIRRHTLLMKHIV